MLSQCFLTYLLLHSVYCNHSIVCDCSSCNLNIPQYTYIICNTTFQNDSIINIECFTLLTTIMDTLLIYTSPFSNITGNNSNNNIITTSTESIASSLSPFLSEAFTSSTISSSSMIFLNNTITSNDILLNNEYTTKESENFSSKDAISIDTGYQFKKSTILSTTSFIIQTLSDYKIDKTSKDRTESLTHFINYSETSSKISTEILGIFDEWSEWKDCELLIIKRNSSDKVCVRYSIDCNQRSLVENSSEAVFKIEQKKIQKLKLIQNWTLEELKKLEEKYAFNSKLSFFSNILAIFILSSFYLAMFIIDLKRLICFIDSKVKLNKTKKYIMRKKLQRSKKIDLIDKNEIDLNRNVYYFKMFENDLYKSLWKRRIQFKSAGIKKPKIYYY